MYRTVVLTLPRSTRFVLKGSESPNIIKPEDNPKLLALAQLLVAHFLDQILLFDMRFQIYLYSK